MICGSIRCVARRPPNLAQHARLYANDKSNLLDLAARIKQTGSIRKAPPAFKVAPTTPYFAAPDLPAGFRNFVLHKPYNPYDFQPVNRLPPTNRKMIEPLGPSRPLAVRGDVFYQLGINPLDEVLNCNLISSFTTEMGRIQKRNETKLTWKSQRKIGKAIRRARSMGLIPTFSRWEDSMIKE